MAAEAVVSFVVGKVGDLLIEEALLLHGVRDQIEWIERELKQMRCFLKDADARQKENESIKNWVSEIRDISYDVEDVIDTFIYMVARGRRQGFLGLLKRYSCIFNELITRHKVGKEIQGIKVRINDISSRRLTYGIKDISEATSTNQNMHDRRRYFALLEEPDVVGFEEYRKTLKEQLNNGDSRRAVISIVGMGGSVNILKTMLERHMQQLQWWPEIQFFLFSALLLYGEGSDSNARYGSVGSMMISYTRLAL